MRKDCNHKRYAEPLECRDCKIEQLQADLVNYGDNLHVQGEHIKHQAEQIDRLKSFISEFCKNYCEGDVNDRCYHCYWYSLNKDFAEKEKNVKGQDNK